MAMTMKRLLAVGLFGAAIMSATPASADSLNLTGLGKGEWITVKFGNTTELGWAGEANWLLSSQGFTVNSYTYCVGLFDGALNTQNPVTAKSTDDLNSSTTPYVTDGAGARAAWLFNTYSDGIHSLLTNTSQNAAFAAAQAAGLQLAIWETLYPTNAFTFQASAAATTAAGQYLKALGSNTSSAIFFDAKLGQGQDQITKVPEPATVLLCLLALPLLFVFRRRRLSA